MGSDTVLPDSALRPGFSHGEAHTPVWSEGDTREGTHRTYQIRNWKSIGPAEQTKLKPPDDEIPLGTRQNG